MPEASSFDETLGMSEYIASQDVMIQLILNWKESDPGVI
jgi:hypothetical protein